MNPLDIISKVKSRLLAKGGKPDLSPQAEAVIHELADAFSVRLKEVMAERSGRMKKPTMEEVSLYGQKIGLPCEESVAFFNFYECKAWMVGKNPMKNWHSAMANWKKGWEERRYTRNTTTAHTTTVSHAEALLKRFQ